MGCLKREKDKSSTVFCSRQDFVNGEPDVAELEPGSGARHGSMPRAFKRPC